MPHFLLQVLVYPGPLPPVIIEIAYVELTVVVLEPGPPVDSPTSARVDRRYIIHLPVDVLAQFPQHLEGSHLAFSEGDKSGFFQCLVNQWVIDHAAVRVSRPGVCWHRVPYAGEIAAGRHHRIVALVAVKRSQGAAIPEVEYQLDAYLRPQVLVYRPAIDCCAGDHDGGLEAIRIPSLFQELLCLSRVVAPELLHLGRHIRVIQT